MNKLFTSISAFMLTFVGVVSNTLASSGGGGDHAARGIADPAPGYDHLWYEALVDITVIGVICALIITWFLFAYRRKNPDDVGKGPTFTTAQMFGWAIIPAFTFMADDFFLALKGWDLWNVYRTMPENATEVKLEASMWNWNFTYDNGYTSDNILIVEEGTPVVMKMRATDVLHAMYVYTYRVKEDTMPGRTTRMWFYPKVQGIYNITCTEYCGDGHSRMFGWVRVVSKAQYANLMADENAFDAYVSNIEDEWYYPNDNDEYKTVGDAAAFNASLGSH